MSDSIERTYLLSCKNHGIDEDSAIEVANAYKEEFGYFPSTWGEALRVLE